MATPANPDLQPPVWHRDMWERTFGREIPVDLTSNWPDGVRIAVMLTFDTQGDVDAAVPGYQNSSGFWRDGAINYVDLGQRQYDTRRGVQRILDILARHEIRSTFPTTGITVEWYPEVAEAILAGGHELAVHGYRHVPLFNLSEDEERAEIEAATEAIRRVMGEMPRGWRSPMYSTTPNTIRLLTEAGYLYNSDFHNDDLPYLLENDGETIVEIPAGLDDWMLNLMQVPENVGMGGVPYSSPAHVTDILTSNFDMLYLEAADSPRLMQWCMHPKITGMPHRSWGLEQVIGHIKSHDGVWFCAMEDVARLCA